MKRRTPVIAIVAVVIVVLILTLASGRKSDIGEATNYRCDVNVISFNTDIEVLKDDELEYTISGNIFRLVTDPLTLYSKDGEELAYASDQFHVISQDSHVIIWNNDVIEMAGKFKAIGNAYDIYVNDKYVGNAEFNCINTKGNIKDKDGNLITDYTSNFIMQDYDVRIKENDIMDDKEILMLFASYYSDFK